MKLSKLRERSLVAMNKNAKGWYILEVSLRVISFAKEKVRGFRVVYGLEEE